MCLNMMALIPRSSSVCHYVAVQEGLYVSVLKWRQALKGHEAVVEEAVVEEAVAEEAVAEEAVVEEAVVE